MCNFKNAFNKNSTYRLKDIAKTFCEKYPDAYQHLASCQTTMSEKANRIGLKPINGQKRNKYYSGLDAVLLCEEIEKTNIIINSDKNCPQIIIEDVPNTQEDKHEVLTNQTKTYYSPKLEGNRAERFGALMGKSGCEKQVDFIDLLMDAYEDSQNPSSKYVMYPILSDSDLVDHAGRIIREFFLRASTNLEKRVEEE